jgi:hypothetical protein
MRSVIDTEREMCANFQIIKIPVGGKVYEKMCIFNSECIGIVFPSDGPFLPGSDEGG